MAALGHAHPITIIPPGALCGDILDENSGRKYLTFGSEDGCNFRDVVGDLNIHDGMIIRDVTIVLHNRGEVIKLMMEHALKHAATVAIDRLHQNTLRLRRCIFIQPPCMKPF